MSPRAPLALFSIVIPARDEAGCIAHTVKALHDALSAAGIPHEIVVVNDNSTDDTWEILTRLAATRIPTLRPVQNPAPHGFGWGIRRGPCRRARGRGRHRYGR